MRLSRCMLAGLVAVGIVAGFTVDAADEIKSTVQVTAEKGELKITRKPGTSEITMNGDSYSDVTQTFVTTVTNVVEISAGVTTNGVAVFQSLWTNTAHYVDLGPTNGTAFLPQMRVRAQERHSVRLHPTTVLHGVAVGASLQLRTTVLED